MAKLKVLCAHCDAKIAKPEAFCPNCSQPTVFANMEQRTAWELEQWAKKRGTPKKAVARAPEPHIAKPAARPKRETKIEQPVMAPAAMDVPTTRVRPPRTIHPAVAARAAREAAATPERISEPVSPMPEKRVIVLPETGVRDQPKPARAPKKEAPAAAAPLKTPAPKKEAPAAGAPQKASTPKKEAAPKKVAAAAAKSEPKPKPAAKKAPKMAPMPLEMPVPKNGNGNGHASNGHANGDGHPANGNGNGHAPDATAEQTEILRELLRRVTAIEEKMTAPRARRSWLRKR